LIRYTRGRESVDFLASIVQNNKEYAKLILNKAISDMSLLVGYVLNRKADLRCKIENLVDDKAQLQRAYSEI